MAETDPHILAPGLAPTPFTAAEIRVGCPVGRVSIVRTADGLGSVPDEVLQAATAMGIGRVRRFFGVELPLAVPVISAGLRVAAVSNVSIVSVAALLGIPQLGSLFTDGFARDFVDPIVVGIIACMVLAFALDLSILGASRALTPWLRTSRPAVGRAA